MLKISINTNESGFYSGYLIEITTKEISLGKLKKIQDLLKEENLQFQIYKILSME